jgi:flagellar basal body-associated protein FliL
LEIVVGMLYWLVIIVVLVALWYAGMLRPTGLVGRTRAEEERERQQDAVAKWLKKDSDDKPL